ncbi:Kinesin-associated protein 3, partial [Blomia tropicalis]
KTIFKKIEADPNKNCLVVYYDIANVSNQNNNHNNESNGFKQMIRISKAANRNVDISKLAKKIQRKCDIIPNIRLPEVLFALLELNRNGSLSSNLSYEFPFVMQNFLTKNSSLELNQSQIDVGIVSLGQLDYYIELLYDELEDKIKGAFAIFKLVSDPENIKSLSMNDTLLCALSRVLREDGKKSLELSIYISCIFSHFAQYADFHFAISNYKVGSTCLELIYFEVLREESWGKELNQKKNIAEKQLENLKAKLSYEKLLVSYQSLVKKQNILFKYALYILMNISEDLKLEFKIINKEIISLLVKLLERNNQDLLLIIVIYLKKLSVFIENKNQMKELSVLKYLTALLFVDNELLIFNTLKLMYNLMIDREIRISFIRNSSLSKLISFFGKGSYMPVIVSIFYLISCEAKYVVIFANYPQLIGQLLEKALQNVDYRTVLYDLLANMAHNPQLAQIMYESEDFNEIVKITFLDNNINLLRLCRNISCHDNNSLKLTLVNFQENLIETMINSQNNTPQLIECAATLTNLSRVQSDWLDLYQKYPIYNFLIQVFDSNSKLKKSNTSNVLWYVLLFVAATCHQAELSVYLIKNNFVDRMIELLNENQENDEIVLNIIYCCYVLVKMAVDLRPQIIEKSKLPDYLIDLMYDRNFRIKSLCTATLDLISENGTEFADRVKHEKFNSYNSKWLNMVQSDRASDESSHSILEDMFIYPDLFLKMDILNDSSSDNLSCDDNPLINENHSTKRPI